ncbi:MAG: YebC/PmpR family DNA-binding transcriptional regulator, partial [Gammaproteobacteria bacterium]
KHVGIIEARRERADADPELAAIEAGAQDLESWEDGSAMFYTDLTDLDAVTHALPEFGYAVLSAKPGYRANNPVSLPAEARAEVEAFLQALDDDDDVQNVFAGLAD